ncbi:MAG: hypothetical protein LC642_02780 [Verrucomicrobiaceae bacterium]|nr:hypothetical protein [Verrucomicrobiaceae bacterium]
MLYRYVVTKDEPRPRNSLAFWILVVLPLFFTYLLRLPFPDVSFDVLNVRLFHGARALQGFLYHPGDFFPTPAPYNTTPDMVMGITRLLFGYRLGTIVNLFALIWAGSVLGRILHLHISNAWVRSGAVLLIFAVEHVFFEINTYMVDLLALPLLLEAIRLALRAVEPEKRSGHMVRIAFLLGLSLACKLINVIAALPIVLLGVWILLTDPRAPLSGKGLLRTGFLSLAAFAAPMLPFSIYLYQEMGSPVFPFLNGIFRSPYWPASSVWDPRWGPVGFWEKLSWPVQTLFRPERLSELSVYSGRLSLGLIGAALALVLAWRNKELRRLSFLALAGLFLWSATTGYIRYALFLELLAGLILVMVVAHAARSTWQLGLAAVVLCLLGTQAAVACHYVGKMEWSRRPTIFQLPALWQRETQHLLRDYSLRRFSPKADRTRFAQVEIWIESSMKTASLEILLNDKAPVIGLRSHESFAVREARLRFVNALERAAGKRMFTICLADDLAESLEFIKLRGLTAGAQTPLMLPFYSSDIRLALILIEVTGAEHAAAAMRQTL